MITVNVVREESADIDRLWAILGDFGNLSWVPGLESSQAIGSGIGMIRRVTLPGGETIDEKLERIDADKMRVFYTIAKRPAFPFDNFSASVSLSATENGRVRIQWHAQFDSEMLPPNDAAATMEGTYQMMITALLGEIAKV